MAVSAKILGKTFMGSTRLVNSNINAARAERMDWIRE